MKKIQFAIIIGFCSFWCNSFAQSSDTLYGTTDTLYFPFYNGVQMIEIDHLTYYEMMDIRFSTMNQMPIYENRPFANEYFFRNEAGKIVKSFNSSLDHESLESRLRPVSFINQPSHIQSHLSMFDSMLLYGTKNDKEVYYRIFNHNYQDFFDRDTSLLKTGLIDTLGNIIFPHEFTELVSLGNGSFIAAKNHNYGVITLDNTELIPCEFYQPSHSMNGLLFFSDHTQAKFAFRVNDKRVFTIPSNRYQLTSFVPELFVITRSGKDGVWNILTNQQIVPNQYDHITLMNYDHQPHGIAIKVLSGNKYGLFDVDGKVILPCVYDEIGQWYDVDGNRVLKVVKDGVTTEIKLK